MSSDKSNRFVVLKRSQYLLSGMKHTENDRVVDTEEIKRFENVLNSHTRWICNIFKASSSWQQEDRMVKNITENGQQTCPMVCLIKDHKGWQYTEDTRVPPSRPVIAGNVGINRNISEILSLLIEPLTSDLGGDSIDSTGDMLHQIDQLNKSGVIRQATAQDQMDSEIDKPTDEPDGLIHQATVHDLSPSNEPNELGQRVVCAQKSNFLENNQHVRSRINKLRVATLPDSNIPDVKKRLVASGLIDRIEEGSPIRLPCGTEQSIKPSSIQQPGFVLIGSDVEKLYPSIRPIEGARLARLAFLESKIDVQDVDLTLALIHCGRN